MFMTRSLNLTLKPTEPHLIIRSGKSEAEVTNNKTALEILYASIDGHKASRGFSTTAEKPTCTEYLLVFASA